MIKPLQLLSVATFALSLFATSAQAKTVDKKF